jgi:hypothetical protein
MVVGVTLCFVIGGRGGGEGEAGRGIGVVIMKVVIWG